MTTSLEEDLAHTLAGAAERAPEPDEGFVVGVRQRRRARRNRRIAAVAACATVLTVASGLGVVRLTRPADEGVPVAAWSGTVPDFDTVESPDKVWPEAVRRLPLRLPNGSEYQVHAVLGNDRYLVSLVSWGMPEVEERWAPWVFDAKSGGLTFLGQKEKPDNYSAGSDDWATAVGDYAIWFSGGAGSDDAEGIWVARLDGDGEPRKLGVLPIRVYGLPTYGLTKDAVYWHVEGSGVYRVPLSGGAPELIRGSEGYAATGLSPWVNTKERPLTGPGPGPEELSGELWDLETGERRPWRTTVPGATGVTCAPLQCTGLSGNGRHFVHRLDGTAVQALPYGRDDFHPFYSMEGRFGLGTVRTSHGEVWYVWDLVTGLAGTVSADSPPGRDDVNKPGFTQAASRGFEDSLLQWPADEQSIYVLDLKAIG